MESVAQKMAELPLDAHETPDENKFLIIWWDSPYETPYKIWSL